MGAAEREENLLILAKRYARTPSEEAFLDLAAGAAVRDARNAEGAVAVAQRYPGDKRLPELVERFPAAFLKVKVKGREVQVAVEPAIPLEGEFKPTIRWVARDPAGDAELWDLALRDALAAWGVPEALLGPLPKGTDAPKLPLCVVPNQPKGWGPAVEVEVRSGRVLSPAGFDEGCGEETWPGFLVFSGPKAVGLSLRPGHLVDLVAPVDASGRKNIRSYLGANFGDPQLSEGRIFQRTEAAWVVDPISGGSPWASGRGPVGIGLPLAGTLRSAPFPEGWSVIAEESGLRVHSATLARMPPAMQRWVLPKGEARVLPIHVRGVFGLLGAQALPPRSPAPALDASAGWVRASDGALQRVQPAGADIAGIRQMDEGEIEAALGVLAGVGVKRGRVQALDGWKVDVDNDRVAEVIVRALVDKEGVVLVVDPIEGDEALTAEDARVFLIAEPGVRSDAQAADLPFAFRKGDFVYMAWGGQTSIGRTAKDRFLICLRFDGTGFSVDRFPLR